MEIIKQALAAACKDLFNTNIEPELTRPDEQFGDYSTNAALLLAKSLPSPPAGGSREIAEMLAKKLGMLDDVAKAEVAGPGFINIVLTDDAIIREANEVLASPDSYGRQDSLKGQQVVAEYSDPNPFKVLHAGHLYTSVVGDALANLFEAAGAIVHRVNFGGDVGLHVGKTMWAILEEIGGEHLEKLWSVPSKDRAEWMAAAYIKGTTAYEEDESAKAQINELNKRVYQLQAARDRESPFAQIYWTTRQWSYDYFDRFYAQIGSKFEKYYPESETGAIGLEAVKKHIGDVFKLSEGAVIFDGEAYGLHTRVFITSEGLPTYETKDVGLILKKWQDYEYDRSIVITGNEQEQYMAVVLRAVEQFEPKLAEATTHLTHGMVRLKGGEKMSSRKGNILRAVDVLEAASMANKAATGNEDEKVTLGAVKYAFLKQRLGGDIIYDPAESVSLTGNSGPYLQYAYVRANSILRKSETAPKSIGRNKLTEHERALLSKIPQYPEVVKDSINDLLPSHIATYLYELATVFNRFYENSKVIGDERQADRLAMVEAYKTVLKNGLDLLNIPTPEHM